MTKPRQKSKANYFTSETDKYIIEYNRSTDPVERSKIFQEHLYYPFYKLIENLIHTFKFHYTDVDKIEDLKFEIMSVIIEEKISKFDPTLGFKAYSYFGTIVKRWLIHYNDKNYRRLKQMTSFSDVEEQYEPELDLDTPNAMPLSKFLDLYVEEMYEELDVLFSKDSEKIIADAVLTIFKTRHELEIFKKKALYIYIREIAECETPHLTKVVSKLKEEFYKRYSKYYELGTVTNIF